MDNSSDKDCQLNDPNKAKERKPKREVESVLIAAQNNAIRTIIYKQKLIIRNRISSIDYVETDMKELITLSANITNYHKRNSRVSVVG